MTDFNSYISSVRAQSTLEAPLENPTHAFFENSIKGFDVLDFLK